MSKLIFSIPEIKNIVAPIAEKYGVERMFLFGSYARGEATEQSDIDLRYDAKELKGLFAIGGLYSDLEEKLEKQINLIRTGNMSSSFYQHIKDDEVILYEL